MTATGSHTPQTRYCRWLLRPGQPPIADVRLTVDGGVLADISPVPADERHLIAPVAIAPQFVNAHTHLEFSSLTHPLEPRTPFPDWIRAVIGYRRQHPTQADIQEAVTQGLTECRQGGTALIGEITTSDAGASALAGGAGSTISFREFIGFHGDVVDDRIAQLHNLGQTVADESPVIPGLSPHAPYSVNPRLFEAIVTAGRERGWVVAMHLAETRDELELLQHRRGLFRELLAGLNLWDDSALGEYTSIRPYLEGLAGCHRALAIHGNYLTDDEIMFLSRHPHVAVVYCPRTHAWFGHPPHPAERLRQAGVTVVLGTDSRASNPDLSIWRELQHATRAASALSGVAGDSPARAIWDLLPEITTTAAAALSRDAADFAITVGRPLQVVELSCRCETQAALNDALLSAACNVLSPSWQSGGAGV